MAVGARRSQSWGGGSSPATCFLVVQRTGKRAESTSKGSDSCIKYRLAKNYSKIFQNTTCWMVKRELLLKIGSSSQSSQLFPAVFTLGPPSWPSAASRPPAWPPEPEAVAPMDGIRLVFSPTSFLLVTRSVRWLLVAMPGAPSSEHCY